MKITLEQLWGSTYQPWLSTSEPWNTLTSEKDLTISIPTATIKSGFKCLCEILEQLWGSTYQPWLSTSEPWNTLTVATLTLSNPDITIKRGVKYLASASTLTLLAPTPKKIGALWERIVKTTGEIWTNINKGTGKWEKYGTILWSWINQPWLSTYQPWLEKGLEKGGAKPVTNYEGTPDVTTNYLGGNKPTTIIYDNINKPNN